MRVSIAQVNRNLDVINTKQKCQVDSNCQQLAVGSCSERAYRGCTMAFCNDHSG